jgi:putative intracellular protease/amidase
MRTLTRSLLAVALEASLVGCATANMETNHKNWPPTSPESRARDVLVVLSSAARLDLRDGKQYGTGYYLAELTVPLQQILEAGFKPVFANPAGNPVTFDPASNNKLFFGGDEGARARAVAFLRSIPELGHPKTLASIQAQGTADYVGIFIPGGHAPMQDLIRDKTLGDILLSFHSTRRPTGVICHGTVALLSTLPDPAAFWNALVAGDAATATSLARSWPYVGYRMTVFSSQEEASLEGQNNQLGGRVLFYAEDALNTAGARLEERGLWQPNVVEDGELVSGQQPFSAEALGRAFVTKLRAAVAQ